MSSRDFRECSVCKIERLKSTLSKAGVCPFCVDKPASSPPEPVEAPLKKTNAKRTTRVKPTPKVEEPQVAEPAKVEDRPAVDPDREREAVREEVKEMLTLPYDPPAYVAAQDPLQELAQRELCRRKLLPFIQRFRPKYLAGWVHADICRRLERFKRQVEAGESPRLLLMMPPRAGKQLADDTLVPTPGGWKTHGELRPGDEVFHSSGKPVKVLAVSEKTVSDVRVTFSDGSTFLCHENHEWVLYNRMRRKWQVIEAGHFLRTTRFGAKKGVLCGKRSMYQLPVAGPLEFDGEEFDMHPYVLGAWLGDGSSTKPCITGTASDAAIVEKIAGLGYQVSTVCRHKTTGVLTTYFSGTAGVEWPGRMTRELQSMGLIGEKRIPPSYQRLSINLRLELLAGLVDTDGTTDRNGRVSITTVSLALAHDIVELCEGLGFRPYMREVQPTLSSSGIQGRRVCYIVGFQPTRELPVALHRKQPKRLAQQRRVGLVSVERVDEADAQIGHCIQVDSPDGQYLVGKKLVTTHNSEIGSRHFAPWVLGDHPDWEIIAASHTASLTMSFSRYIRDLMRDPAYQAIFQNAKLDPGSQSVENWNTTKGGGYLAAGVGTGITGRGAHVLLLDDLVKDIEAADSDTISENTWEWYASTAYTRLAPGGGVLGIMTWWSETDWAGRIQQVMASGEGDKFEIVKYPAINDEGDEYLLPDDSIVQIAPLSKVPDGAKLTRVMNTAVHPARYDTEAMLRIKRNLVAAGQKRIWQALYQQNPTPDDGLHFTKDMFKKVPVMPRLADCHIFQAWDFAITENTDSDYTVGSTIAQDHEDNLYVLDVVRFRSSDAIYIVDTILDYWGEWKCNFLGFEDGQIWKTMEAQFDKRCRERRMYPNWELLKPLTDKLVRAHPLKGRMQAGKVFFYSNGAWFEECERELLRFPGGKHDDQVDSLAWNVRLTLGSAPPKDPRPAARMPESWKKRLNALVAGKGGGHMSS